MIFTLQPSTGQALGSASAAGATSAPVTIPAAHSVARPTRTRHLIRTASTMLICRTSLSQDGRRTSVGCPDFATYRRQPTCPLADGMAIEGPQQRIAPIIAEFGWICKLLRICGEI